jgi:hypothetical protein
MGKVASCLDNIVEQVTLALQQDTSQDFKERIQETESVICLCRYPHDNTPKQNERVSDNTKGILCEYALRFYLPMEHCIFYIQTERGPLSFDAGPEHIVVTVGKQLEVIIIIFCLQFYTGKIHVVLAAFKMSASKYSKRHEFYTI